jgi:hypothetical protein
LDPDLALSSALTCFVAALRKGGPLL